MFGSIILRRRIRLAMFLSLGVTLLGAHVSSGADAYSVGQKVQVREGDTWSAASVLAHEGRRYQIRYDSGGASDSEWVGTDRIRSVPDGAEGAPANAAAATNPPGAIEKSAFKTGDQIEAKWGGLWRKASIIKQENGWTMVQYDNVWYEWVQPWRLRQIGSDQDTALDSTPRSFVQESTAAPTQTPQELSAADTSGSHHDAADVDAFHISSTVGPGGIAITKVDRTGHVIAPSTVRGTAVPDAAISLSPMVIGLGEASIAAGAKMDVLTTSQGNFALLATLPADWHQSGSIQRIDLHAAKAGNPVLLAALVVPLSINPDGTRMITRSDKFFPATKWRLDLWTADTEHPKPLLSFRPFAASTTGTDQVLWARYVDASHVLACSGSHTLSLWEISDTSVKSIYSLQGDTTVQPQLSAGGKYVIVGYGGQVLVCDALTGKCAAQTKSLAGIDAGVADINADVTRLAMCGASRLVVCDLHTGETIIDTGLPVGVTASEVSWISPNLLLIDSRWVFDTAHHAMVWEYTAEDHPPCTKSLGSMLAIVNGADENRTLSFANPLDPALVKADEQLADGAYEIQRGTKVSLVLNLSCPQTQKDKITESLKRRIQQAGLILADDQPVQLVADVKDFDPRQVTYRGMGFGRGNNETVTVSSTAEVLSFVKDSKPIWSVNSTSAGFAPMVMLHKPKESVAQALEEQKNGRLNWFTLIGIPKTVLKSADLAGSSPLSALIRSGPRDAN